MKKWTMDSQQFLEYCRKEWERNFMNEFYDGCSWRSGWINGYMQGWVDSNNEENPTEIDWM